MDKSMHSDSPFAASFKNTSHIGSGRKSVLGMSGGLRSAASGRLSMSGRPPPHHQTIATKSEFNQVETFGSLPVMVNEALTFGERNSLVSVNSGGNGWAWVVFGRRLLVWQYKDSHEASANMTSTRTPQRRATSAQCRELTLPHCDIGHKASLIKVFVLEGQQMASCLAVSPTGDVRYWPSIAHDGSSIDVTGILDGQEFDNVYSIDPYGYVLVTTTCNLVLLQIEIINGRPVIQHRAVKSPTGFFGGIGKKFASIIIGINSGTDKENKFLKIAGIKESGSNWKIMLLADRWIQAWMFSGNGSEKFLFEDHELPRKIREEFQEKLWNGRELNDIDVTLLDMQVADEKIYVLCGAVNNPHTPQMHYAIAVLELEADTVYVSAFHTLNLSHFYSSSTQAECTQLHFILHGNVAYLYGNKTIYPINLASATPIDAEAGKIEFQAADDKIMNAFVSSPLVLFFTRSRGLVSVSSTDFETSHVFNSSYVPELNATPSRVTLPANTSLFSANETAANLYELDPDEMYNDNDDALSRLKAAFIYHLKGNSKTSNSILAEFLEAEDSIQTVDALLDKTVIRVAEELVEDIPVADPRWKHYENNQKFALGSSSSLQILSQLKEKCCALNHFVAFLHSTNLWEKLNCVSHRGTLKATSYVLSDINEKTVAAIALKCAQTNFPRLVEEAIQTAMADWNEAPTGNLLAQDIFYVRVTRFPELFRALCEIAEKKIGSQLAPSAVAALLCDINTIVLAILGEVHRFRETKASLYTLPRAKQNSFEYQPWTTMSGKNGLRDSLLHFAEVTLKYGARSTGEPDIKQRMYQQLVELVDCVLGGRKAYLDSIADSEKHAVLLQQYESQRKNLIFPLVEDKQYDLAAKLAEKYLDFNILVIICDRTQNQQRLDQYIEKYQEHGFSQVAINWHLRQDRKGDLFEKFKTNQAALSQFLGNHPPLAWIQLILNGDFERASKILLQLAQEETEYCARMKSMLSLAKLASLAADSDLSPQVADISSRLSLIDYQSQIPDTLMQNFGYDTENPKVLKAEEIINLLISEENETATEVDFRKALELLPFVESPVEVQHKIWCAAILRDSWTDYDMTAPLSRIQTMTFFKLIEVCYLMDGDLDVFLPKIDDFLTSPELGDLIDHQSFQYLMQLGYEHVKENFHKKDVLMEEEE